jgi:uncharacterized coiled-coil protein SlyX
MRDEERIAELERRVAQLERAVEFLAATIPDAAYLAESQARQLAMIAQRLPGAAIPHG